MVDYNHDSDYVSVEPSESLASPPVNQRQKNKKANTDLRFQISRMEGIKLSPDVGIESHSPNTDVTRTKSKAHSREEVPGRTRHRLDKQSKVYCMSSLLLPL